ncbi:substrate-binding domain-containing protein [Mesoterricola silvestris]|uniref:Phosphate ABC transporter substrate-binding protein n=1 Tax=Mesoterricola silvestris TaxID=2927979 RepID=A0AA48K944_9BACT|nr:substrate-binding domain-containing protein [Mesoterricola silvestris]BDU73026.1 phosphate ABC transporter substrate-binding protein [Mesoterricola silvestris]
MKRLPERAGVLLVSALLLAMGSLHAADGGAVLRVGGAGAGLGTLKRLGEAFQNVQPGAKVQMVPNLGSSGGIKALLDGAVDLAVAARPLRPGEFQGGARAHPYGRTPFLFIANLDVPSTQVTPADLEALLEGRLRNWPGGPRARIVLRPLGDGDTDLMAALSPAMAQALRAAHGRTGMVLAVTDQEALDAVARIPGALGTSTLAQLVTEPRSVKVLRYNGSEPNLKNLAAGAYPLAKAMALVTGPRSPALAQAFLRFVRSPQGRALLSATGHLPEEGEP